MKAVAWLVASALICAPTMAADTEIAGLSPETRAACIAEGGCTLYTARALKARMDSAVRAGFDAGKTACRGET